MTTRPLSHIADWIAADLRRDLRVRDVAETTRSGVMSLRDECDIATRGELDATQLDIVTDMVAQRLRETPERR
jgi:hypothetical protein